MSATLQYLPPSALSDLPLPGDVAEVVSRIETVRGVSAIINQSFWMAATKIVCCTTRQSSTTVKDMTQKIQTGFIRRFSWLEHFANSWNKARLQHDKGCVNGGVGRAAF